MPKKKSIKDAKSTFAPLPYTKRGYGIHISGTLEGNCPRLVYCNAKKVIVKNLENQADVSIFSAHKSNVNTAKFSPNGEWIASGDSNGTVFVWGSKNHVIKNEVRVCLSVLDISWSEDSKRIVAVGNGSQGLFGKAFNFDSTNSIGEISHHTKPVLSCDIRPKRPLKVVTGSEDYQSNFYSGPPFKFTHWKRDNTNYINCVRFDPSGDRFATVSSDKKIGIYNGEIGELEHLIDEKAPNQHKGSIYSCCFNEDSSKLLTCSGDKTAKIWNMESFECETTFDMGKDIDDMQVACLWLGDYIISVSLSGNINFLDPENPNQHKNVWFGHQVPTSNMAVSEDGQYVFTGDQSGKLVRWDMKSAEAKVFKGKGHKKYPVTFVAVSADGKNLFSTGYDDKLFISSIESLETSKNYFEVTGQPQFLVSGNKNANLCVIGTTKKILFVFLHEKCETKVELGFEPTCACFSPDDAQLIVGGNDKFARLYNVSGSKLTEKEKIGSHQGPITSISYSKNGKFLTTTDNQRHINIWDADSDFKKPLNSRGWLYHSARVVGSAWRQDNVAMATASSDQNIWIWPNANEAKPRDRVLIENAHESGITDIKALGESEFISIGDDHCIRVWDFVA